MALEFLNYDKIESNKRINLPKHANVYYLNLPKKTIVFYHSNPKKKIINLNTWNLHENAREMDFEFRDDKIGSYIIIPKFYDSKGNFLKIGNR